MSRFTQAAAATLLLSTMLAAQADNGASATLPIPPSGVIGVDRAAMLTPEYWIARANTPDKLLLTPQQIEEMNAKSNSTDPATRDLTRVAPVLSREQVLAWLKEAANPPTKPLVNAKGEEIPAAEIAAAQANAGVDKVAASTPARYGLSVRRATLRTYPTTLAAYATKDSTDFEVFQGGVLFPGEPLVIAHESVDGQWFFALTTQGPVWIKKIDVAVGAAAEVFGYTRQQPYRVVTGDKIRTVYTPEAPEVSELQLDMGTRVPLAALPEGEPVNGQGPYVSWTVMLPVRHDDGTLGFEPALVQKIKDTTPGYLPLTRENIIRQSFKFLGERYGWGHQYNARDCSGFTSDVYRSMGVLVQPNSGAQGASPAFRHQLFTAADSHVVRLKAVMQAQVGDLIVVPGHVLMLLGQVDGQPYVIQDVPYAVFHDPATGKVRMTKINEVSVTPLLPLMADDKNAYVDAMTSLVHVTAR